MALCLSTGELGAEWDPERRGGEPQHGRLAQAELAGRGEDSWGPCALARRLALLLALDLLLLMESGQWPLEAGTCVIFSLWMTPRSC